MIVFVGTSDLKQMKCFLNAKPIFELKSDGAFRDNYFQMTERWIFFLVSGKSDAEEYFAIQNSMIRSNWENFLFK